MSTDRDVDINVNVKSAAAEKAWRRQGAAVRELDKNVNKANKGARAAAGSLSKIALGGAVVGGVTALAGGLVGLYKAGQEGAKVMRVLDSQIANLGATGKQAFAGAAEFAEKLSVQIGKDDDRIKGVQAKLASFPDAFGKGSLGAEAMQRATAAAFDLEAAGIGAAEGQIVGIGKALNDPIKGMTALSKSGVSFNATQQQQIKDAMKAGDLAKAQSILLTGIESNAKGAAAASASGVERMQQKFALMRGSVEDALVPAVEKFANFMMKNSPAIEAGLGKVGAVFRKIGDGAVAGAGIVKRVFINDVLPTLGKLKAGAEATWRNFGPGIMTAARLAGSLARTMSGPLAAGFKQAWGAVSALAGSIKEPWMQTFIGVVGGAVLVIGTLRGAAMLARGAMRAWAAAQRLLNLAMSMNPLGVVIVAVAALAAGIVYAYKKSDRFRNIVNGTWAKLKAFGSWLASAGTAAIAAFSAGFDSAKNAASKFADGVGFMWDKIKEVARNPIKFYIETVWNNGLIRAFNTVGDMVGLPKIPNIPLPQGFASGGVLPGWSPGRDIHRFTSPTGGILDLSGGEAIMRPEFTAAMGGPRGIADLNAKARAGMLHQQFALGGVFGVADTIKNAISGAKKATNTLPGSFAGMVVGAVSRIGKAALDKIKSVVGMGEKVMGWKEMAAWVQKYMPWAVITSSVRPGAITASGNTSYHARGRALDLVGGGGNNMMDVFNRLAGAFPNATELIHTPAGARQLKNGRSHVYTGQVAAMHYNHVHWAMRNGGTLPQSLTNTTNVNLDGAPIARIVDRRLLQQEQTRAWRGRERV